MVVLFGFFLVLIVVVGVGFVVFVFVCFDLGLFNLWFLGGVLKDEEEFDNILVFFLFFVELYVKYYILN